MASGKDRDAGKISAEEQASLFGTFAPTGSLLVTPPAAIAKDAAKTVDDKAGPPPAHSRSIPQRRPRSRAGL